MTGRAARGGAVGQIREVQRTLRSARDEQIARVVAIVDALSDRRAADALIEPLRYRLAQLRPPRPLRFARLLFFRVDPLVVPAQRWQPGEPTIPRTALLPLADAVQDAAGAVAAEVEALIAGRSCDDEGVVSAAGGRLWAAAARALPLSVVPGSWAETGLARAEYPPLAHAVAGVLEQIGSVDLLVCETTEGLPLRQPLLDSMLEATAARGPLAWKMLVMLLLARLPDPSPIVQRLASNDTWLGDPAGRERADHVIGAALAGLQSTPATGGPVAATELAHAAAEIRRIERLLGALEQANLGLQRRQQAQALRRELDASSQARFEAAIIGEFLEPLRGQSEGAEPIQTEYFEAAARSLRQIEAAARRVGGGPVYDALLQRATTQVKGLPERDGLSRADKLRMVEILSGSDEALAMMEAVA